MPECLPPLDADPDSNGKPSDHMMVVMSPLSVMNNRPARTRKEITFRPFSEIRLQRMQQWIDNEDWNDVSSEVSADKKMDILQKLLVEKYQEYFPEKTKSIFSDDEPFYNEKLGKLKRKKGRVYHKQRKSKKWNKLENEYRIEVHRDKNPTFIREN